MSVIELQKINKVFSQKQNRFHALCDVSLSIAKGEMVAIMGTSGSGKTTLLNIIGCVDKPSEGRYLLKKQAIEKQSPKFLAQVRNQELGFVMQDFALIEYYSVKKNILLPLHYVKSHKLRKNREAKLPELLEKLRIGQKINEPVMNLSGGQKQRVAIARALINNPEIILADEPTGALDQKTSTEIIELLQVINREEGKTIILVTHDPDIAAYCDRIIRIEDGRIVVT